MPDDRSPELKKLQDELTHVDFLPAAKRLGVSWSPYLGDWFTSWTPRNGGYCAEGPWEHWVQLAVQILQHPLTAQAKPELYQLANEHLEILDGAEIDPETITTILKEVWDVENEDAGES